MHACIHTYISLSLSLHIYIYMYTYTYTHTHTHAGKTASDDRISSTRLIQMLLLIYYYYYNVHYSTSAVYTIYITYTIITRIVIMYY